MLGRLLETAGRQAPAAKRQKRGDVLGDLGDFGGLSGGLGKPRRPTGLGAGSTKSALGIGPPAPAPRGIISAPSLGSVGVASAGASKPASSLPAAAVPVAPTAEEASLPSAADKPVAGALPSAGVGDASAALPDGCSSGTCQPPAKTESEAAEQTPARITDENVGDGWRSIFLKAKDVWHIEEEGLRGLFWHSGSGCCFEWDQGEGVLFQYVEEPGASSAPRRNIVWCAEFPDQHAWIWQQLPLPPTDPAAAMDGEDGVGEAPVPGAESAAGACSASVSDSCASSAEACVASTEQAVRQELSASLPSIASAEQEDPSDSGVAPSASSSSSSASASSSQAMMPPPPAMPLKKKPKKPPPKFDEVLDDNAWERKCALREKRAALKGSIDGCGKDPESDEAAGTADLEDLGDLGVDTPSSSSVAVATCAPRPSPLKGEDSDDEDGGLTSAVVAPGPLAEGDEPAALPAAPSDKAKPKACDLDLDMFGIPEEDYMDPVD